MKLSDGTTLDESVREVTIHANGLQIRGQIDQPLDIARDRVLVSVSDEERALLGLEGDFSQAYWEPSFLTAGHPV